MRFVALLSLLATLLAPSLATAGTLKPYVLASQTDGAVDAKTTEVKAALKAQGFQVVGVYAPVGDARVIAVTSGALKAAAAKSEHGGFFAVARVSVAAVGGQVQVAFTDPTYFANAYRMSGDLASVRGKLVAALGETSTFGSAEGLSASDLRKYHYMMGMPYFTDPHELASYGSHAEAVAAVKAGLEAGKGGTKLVYQVAVSGKDEVVFGVGIKAGKGADATVLGSCDTPTMRAVAYAPYEILVSGTQVLALQGKFRIALSFPDLSMGTFMKISSAPGAIRAALEAASK